MQYMIIYGYIGYMCSPICAYLRHKQLGFLMKFRCLRLGFFFSQSLWPPLFFVQTYGYSQIKHDQSKKNRQIWFTPCYTCLHHVSIETRWVFGSTMNFHVFSKQELALLNRVSSRQLHWILALRIHSDGLRSQVSQGIQMVSQDARDNWWPRSGFID
jgi:hypothetical protein